MSKNITGELNIPAAMDAETIALNTLDVSEQDRFEAGNYHPYFARLRREDPVHYCTSDRFGPYWSVTRYQDILEVEKNHAVFSSDRKYGGVTIADDDFSEVLELGASFLTMDRPQHTIHRGIVAPAFSPGNVRALESQIRNMVSEILADLPLNAEFDWVDRVANLLPINVLALLFGVPASDGAKLLRWSNLLIGTDDLEVVESRARAAEELTDFADYFLALRAQSEGADPGNDLMSLVAHGEASRDMSRSDFLATMSLLLIGGNDTTRNTISGGLWALTRFPVQFELLRERNELLPGAINEMLRWVSPVFHMRRTATRDIQLRGRQIRAGDKVVLWYVSGNRDEETYPEPDEFRIERNGARHLSFGAGIHYCIGSRIAEMQLRVLWEELLKMDRKIEVTGEPSRLWSNFINGIKSLPVRISPA
jgi:cytochrome P450